MTSLERTSVRCEVAYAINVGDGSVRRLGEGIKRQYNTTHGWIPGTLDIEAVTRDGGRRILKDFKSGKKVRTCAESWQMCLGAYCLHKYYRVDEVLAQLVYIDEFGNVTVDEHLFDAFELTDVPARLGRVVGAINTAREALLAGNVQVKEGDWCHFCAAYSSCPAKVSLVRSMVTILPSLEQSIMSLTPAEAGAAWAQWKALEPMFERVEKALKDYAKRDLPELPYFPEEGIVTPLVLPDGRIVKAVKKGKETVNAGRALALAREYGASEKELQSCINHPEWIELRTVKATKAKQEEFVAEVVGNEIEI